MARDQRRSARQATHKRAFYAEPDSDEDFEEAGASTAPPPKRSRRAAVLRRRPSYAEADTDDGFETAEPVATRPPPREPTRPQSRPARPSGRSSGRPRAKPQTRSRAKRMKPLIAIGKARRPNSAAEPTQKRKVFSGPSDGNIPKWKSLPVDILKDIFVFASSSANKHLRSPEASADVTWLIKAASTCRAFAQPALEAYYESPVLLNTLQPHELLDLLRAPNERRFMNYNVKVKSLLIDAEILGHVAHNRPLFELGPLVAELPQLQDLEIITQNYLPPYRVVHPLRWTFASLPIVASMTERNVHLKSWRWTRELIAKEEAADLLSTMVAVHTSTAFERLQRLVICGFMFENSSDMLETVRIMPPTTELGTNTASHSQDAGNADAAVQPDERERPPALAVAISKLPALTDLTFTSCDIVHRTFLQHLPSNLHRLELTNCLEITSEMVRDYIKKSGAQLRELVLNHNPALSLGFLAGLEASCPRLQVLQMNLTYYSERLIIKDADPLYDELLSVHDLPTWPSSLQTLELLHAQKWSAEAAANLFRSLIDHADRLPALRRLVLHAHINIPWRDRVGFRDQWTERIARVFMRRAPEPFPYLGSFRQYRLWQQVRSNETTDVHDPDTIRVSPKVRVPPYERPAGVEVYDDRPQPAPQRRSRRVQESLSSNVEPDEDEDASDSSDAGDNWRRQKERFVQGLCDVVDVSIDNQRPRETVFTERDFLDSEKSGDEDWNEDQEEDDGYAW